MAATAADEVTWGDRLRRIRINRHMGQEAFADELGVAKPTIGKYEVMTTPPRTRRLIENSVELRFGQQAAAFLRGRALNPESTVSGVRRHLALAS